MPRSGIFYITLAPSKCFQQVSIFLQQAKTVLSTYEPMRQWASNCVYGLNFKKEANLTNINRESAKWGLDEIKCTGTRVSSETDVVKIPIITWHTTDQECQTQKPALNDIYPKLLVTIL